MRIPRIYAQQALNTGAVIELDENASRHVAKVLRMQLGRELIVFNGEGGEYTAVINDIGKKRVTIELNAFIDADRQSPLEIHLGIGVSRGERMEWVLQKATELGVTKITPLFSERTEVKLTGPRLDKKQQQWQHIIVSACEQCQRNRLPELQAARRLDDWINEADETARFVLHHRTPVTLADTLKPDSIALLIGPEGGLSADEIKRTAQRDFQPLALGPRVLRTETAPLAAISVMQYLWGDLCEK